MATTAPLCQLAFKREPGVPQKVAVVQRAVQRGQPQGRGGCVARAQPVSRPPQLFGKCWRKVRQPDSLQAWWQAEAEAVAGRLGGTAVHQVQAAAALVPR